MAQQAAQLAATLAMIGAITVLARQLSLSEFGTYGLLVSFTVYVFFVQASISTAAVSALAGAEDDNTREQAFSTALVLYIFAGLAAGVLLAAGGSVLLRLFDIPARLHHQAQVGVLALGVVTCLTWPVKVFQDVLRGSERFVASATAEIVGYAAFAAVLIALALAPAPLWLLVATGASAPLVVGAASAGMVVLTGLPVRFGRSAVTAESTRALLGMSKHLSVSGISAIVIYSLDRAVLAVFRPAAVVALYEGPVRVHNLVQQLNAAFSVPVLPAASRYLAEGDAQRTRDLLIRGTRYSLAAIVPITLALMILARPLLTVWLGPEFGVASTAMTILLAYWLINAGLTVAGGMLIAAGRARELAVYAAAVAALNLAFSLALTPSLGLNGVVLGTTLSYVVSCPFFLALTLSAFPVTVVEFAREAWIPAYLTGAVIAAGLLAARLSLPLDTLPAVLATGLLAVLAYWAIYYLVWLRPSERVLVRNVALAVVRR
jgi:membrane protein EpsK